MSASEKVLSRIKKLMALADNTGNVHEAAVALRQAQALMMKYGVAPVLAHQLNQLAQKSPSVAEQVAISVVNGWRQKRISNPVGYLLATLKQAREGKYHVEPAASQQTPTRPVVQANSSTEVQIPACPTGPHIPAGQETVKAMVARIRQQLNC
ncbi:DUF2786 domain-containing protein [Salmonella enterica]|nr:DUF2786 domain-containing protein [Salmonella enterica]